MGEPNWCVRGPDFVYGPLDWDEAGTLSDELGDDFWVEEVPTLNR